MIDLFDAHCDTIVHITEKKQHLYDNDVHVSIKKLSVFNAPVQFFALCIANNHVLSPFQWFTDHVSIYREELDENAAYIAHGNNTADILKNREKQLITSILAIEGAEVLEGNLDNLYKAYDLGVRSINITWNNNNAFGHGSEATVKEGLTALGKELLMEMNRLNIITDVSHLSKKGFWDVCNLSDAPFIASHSNAFSVTPVTRNLTDDQLKACGEKGCVVGLNLCRRFLDIDGAPTMDHILRHVDKMLTLAGENGVGLGCDFDGADPPQELYDVSQMTVLYDALIKAFGPEITEKIFFKNFMSVTEKIMH